MVIDDRLSLKIKLILIYLSICFNSFRFLWVLINLLINVLFNYYKSFISFPKVRLSQDFGDRGHGLSAEAVAKCGYICWNKYVLQQGKDLNKNINWKRLTPKDLDDYQIGELRGCIEECVTTETGTGIQLFVDGINQFFVCFRILSNQSFWEQLMFELNEYFLTKYTKKRQKSCFKWFKD